MKDREFLIWIHDRLEITHKIKHGTDYMNKLRCIINAYDKEKETANMMCTEIKE